MKKAHSSKVRVLISRIRFVVERTRYRESLAELLWEKNREAAEEEAYQWEGFYNLRGCSHGQN